MRTVGSSESRTLVWNLPAPPVAWLCRRCLNPACFNFLLFQSRVTLIIAGLGVATIECNSLMWAPQQIAMFVAPFRSRDNVTEFPSVILFSTFKRSRSTQPPPICAFPREEQVLLLLPKKRWDSDHISVPSRRVQIRPTATWEVLV